MPISSASSTGPHVPLGPEELLGPELLGPELLGPELLGPELLAPELLAPELTEQLAPELLAPELLAPEPLAPELEPPLLRPFFLLLACAVERVVKAGTTYAAVASMPILPMTLRRETGSSEEVASILSVISIPS